MTVKATMPERSLNLVLPLAHKATDVRTTDTAACMQARSGAVSPLIGVDHLRCGDVTSEHPRSSIATTPSTRTSATATPTTTTRAGKAAMPGLSADSRNPAAAHEAAAPFSFHALLQAYRDCRANKRNTATAQQFEQALESNLWMLYEELCGGTYRAGRSICFVVTRPKPREVWAAGFRDRIVHHLLYNHVAPRFHASFTAASSACIPGRGTLYAATRLAKHARSITENWTRPAYYLKCDLSNFFVAIDKHVLAAQLARKVKEPWWLRLTELILFHDPRTDVEVRSPRRLLDLVPAHKSLFNAPVDTGLPIGNLSSQFFAIVHLDALDQFVKHRLKARHYVRYVDDFILLHEDRAALVSALREIERFLPERLHAHLNPRKTVLQPVERGIDFVGHQLAPHRHITRRRTIRNGLRRLEHMNAEEVFAAGNSYLGLVRQAAQSHGDQARIARALMKRGHAVDGDLTRIFRNRNMQEHTHG